ncbi:MULTISPECIES: glycosyltransferase family 61 protein [Halorubrum]|uniref:glycosyltransferase family 61 protein n=1 Tax=Halorubrum TaxID=56688 RepID=UPI0009B5B6B6|nr:MULTISPECIES: glycosyltransferase family 61 protein [Halorubrum]
MAPTHFSFRKLRRKLHQDGIKKTVWDSAEAFYRRSLYPHIFQILSKTNRLQVLDGECIRKVANNTVDIGLESHGPMHELDEGYIFSATGLIMTKDNKVVSQSVGSPELSEKFTIESLAHQDFSKTPVTPKLLRSNRGQISYSYIDKNVCPLIPRYDNYYHWMIGTVPKIRYIERYEEAADEPVTYLLPNNSPSWVQETLSLLGYPMDKFRLAQSPIYKPRRLIVPPHPFPGQKEDYRWIKQNIFNNIDGTNERSTERVFISRNKAIGRRVSNESELMDVLSDYGFEKYYLEDQNISENIRLFSNADVVVSPHGAGLTDIIFCQDTTIIELFGSQKTNSYETVANTLEIPYRKVDCEPDSTDILVDLNVIKDTLEDVLGS